MATVVRQYDYDVRNALISAWIAAIGPSPILRLRTLAPPATVFASDVGSLIVSMTLPSTWQGAPALGVSVMAGVWSGVSVLAGTPKHFRVFAAGSPTECRYQGIISQAFSIATTAATVANSNILTFTGITGPVSVGQSVAGAGIPTGIFVLAKTTNTVTLSGPTTSGVSSGVNIYFGDTAGALWLANTTITLSQAVSVTRHTITAPGA